MKKTAIHAISILVLACIVFASQSNAVDLAVLFGKAKPNRTQDDDVYRCTDCLRDGFQEVRGVNKRIVIDDPRPGTVVIRDIRHQVRDRLREAPGSANVPVVAWVQESCINGNHRIMMDNIDLSLAPGAKIENTRGGDAALVFIECMDNLEITNSSFTSSGVIRSSDH